MRMWEIIIDCFIGDQVYINHKKSKLSLLIEWILSKLITLMFVYRNQVRVCEHSNGVIYGNYQAK